MKLPITPNEPLRMQSNLFGPDEPVYAAYWRRLGDEMRDLRDLRNNLRMSIHESAQRLGLTPEELSGLERGAYAFSPEDAWKLLRGPR